MSDIYIVYSLDPRGWIDVYPKWICQEFTDVYREFLEKGTPDRLVLGERFFGATIHFKLVNQDDTSDTQMVHCHQTSTNGGYRSVDCVLFTGQPDLTTEMYHTDYSADLGGGWRFNPPNSEVDIQPVGVDIPDEWLKTEQHFKKTPIWQWSKITGEQLQKKKLEGEYDNSVTLKRLPDSDWVAYSLEANNLIEEAWEAKQSQIILEVGLRQYKVVFDMNRVFAKQIDINDTSRMRIVKRNPNLTESEINESLRKWEQLNKQVCEGDACPLCYDNFTGSIPIATLKCGHLFHCACLQPMLVNNIRNHHFGELLHSCPMCRDTFTSEEFTELTGNEISMGQYNQYLECR